jgi:hypothetical protein
LVLDAGSSVSVAIPGSVACKLFTADSAFECIVSRTSIEHHSTRFINKTGTPSQNLLITHYSLRITHYFLW